MGQNMSENESRMLIYQADDNSIKIDVLLDKKNRQFRFFYQTAINRLSVYRRPDKVS